MPRFVRWIWRACGIHFAIGMAAYLHFLITGSYRYLNWFFLIFGTLFFLLTTAAESFLALECRAGFDSDEPMRMAWTFIALASLARLTGAILITLNHWDLVSSLGSTSSALAAVFPEGLTQVSTVISGPLSMVFLAIALSRILKVQRKFGVLSGLMSSDFLLIGLIAALLLGETALVVRYLAPPYGHTPVIRVILWLSDPLLTVLLVQAVLIRRSVIRVGHGLISQCWEMYVVAIVTTLAGDASIWAVGANLLSPPFIALTWYIWFFAAAAFASAPAYQLAAMMLPLVHEGPRQNR